MRTFNFESFVIGMNVSVSIALFALEKYPLSALMAVVGVITFIVN